MGLIQKEKDLFLLLMDISALHFILLSCIRGTRFGTIEVSVTKWRRDGNESRSKHCEHYYVKVLFVSEWEGFSVQKGRGRRWRSSMFRFQNKELHDTLFLSTFLIALLSFLPFSQVAWAQENEREKSLSHFTGPKKRVKCIMVYMDMNH